MANLARSSVAASARRRSSRSARRKRVHVKLLADATKSDKTTNLLAWRKTYHFHRNKISLPNYKNPMPNLWHGLSPQISSIGSEILICATFSSNYASDDLINQHGFKMLSIAISNLIHPQLFESTPGPGHYQRCVVLRNIVLWSYWSTNVYGWKLTYVQNFRKNKNKYNTRTSLNLTNTQCS